MAMDSQGNLAKAAIRSAAVRYAVSRNLPIEEGRISRIIDDVYSRMTLAQRMSANTASGDWMARVVSEVQQALEGNKAVNLLSLPFNPTGAGTIEQQLAAFGAHGRALVGGNSGARYDGVEASAGKGDDWSSPAGMAQMREFAVQHGVAWAANNPDILRLGPAAIAILADVHLRQENYRRLTEDAAFRARDVVTLAKFAKDKHLDANDLANDVANSVKGLEPGADEAARRNRETLRDSITGYMAKPEDPKAQEKLDETLKKYESDPAKKPHVDKLREKLQLVKSNEQAATANAQAKTANAGTATINARHAGAKFEGDLDAFASATPAIVDTSQQTKGADETRPKDAPGRSLANRATTQAKPSQPAPK